jgi:hypothetical protein
MKIIMWSVDGLKRKKVGKFTIDEKSQLIFYKKKKKELL